MGPAGASTAESRVTAMRAASRAKCSGGFSSKNETPRRPPPPAEPSRRTPPSQAITETRIENSGCTSSTSTPAEFAIRRLRVSSPRLTITFSMRGSKARAARSARSTRAIRSGRGTPPRLSRP